MVGDQYLEHVISPDHDDVGNTTWWRDAECRACAVSRDQWPIPNGGVMQRCPKHVEGLGSFGHYPEQCSDCNQ
jgi:hypothetical protein